MLDVLKEIAIKAANNEQPIRLMEGVVVTPPPELEVKILDNNKLTLPKELLIVSEKLTKHKRVISLRKVGDPRFKSGFSRPFSSHIRLASTNLQREESIEGYIPHQHTPIRLEMDDVQENSTIQEVECEFEDELKKDDKVLVMSFKGFQKFYIADRITTYSEDV